MVESFKGLVLIRDVKVEGGRQRHPSGGVSAKEMVIGLEGVELGADGKVRSQQKMTSDITIGKNTQTKNIVNCRIFLICEQKMFLWSMVCRIFALAELHWSLDNLRT